MFVLAPMADVTDAAFRRIIAKYGKPDAMWTEFVSADGLALAPEIGRKKLLKNLEYSEAERPIVAQFFTSSPENMEKAAELNPLYAHYRFVLGQLQYHHGNKLKGIESLEKTTALYQSR